MKVIGGVICAFLLCVLVTIIISTIGQFLSSLVIHHGYGLIYQIYTILG
jgi:hypothetical protein